MLRVLLLVACAVLGDALPMSYRHRAVKETLDEKLARTDSTLDRALAKIDELAIKVDEAADDGDFVRLDGDAADLEGRWNWTTMRRKDYWNMKQPRRLRRLDEHARRPEDATTGPTLRRAGGEDERRTHSRVSKGKCDSGATGRRLFWERRQADKMKTSGWVRSDGALQSNARMRRPKDGLLFNERPRYPRVRRSRTERTRRRPDRPRREQLRLRTLLIMAYLRRNLARARAKGCSQRTARAPPVPVRQQRPRGLPPHQESEVRSAPPAKQQAPAGFAKEGGLGADNELDYNTLRVLPKGQTKVKNGKAKYLKDGETTYRVCESTSMHKSKLSLFSSSVGKRSCAKHSGPGADATCKGWCKQWYDARTEGKLSFGYGTCASYTDEDWDKIAALLADYPTSKGKITKKDLDRGNGGEVTRLLIQASIPFYKLTPAELEKMLKEEPDKLMRMLKSHGLQENLSDDVVEILSKLSV